MSESGESQVLTRLKKVTYLGSHPSVTGHHKDLTVTFFSAGVQADPKRGGSIMTLRWDEIVSLRAEDQQSLESRVTGPRFLLLGVWSLAFPKKGVVSYLTIGALDGDWTFAVPGLQSIELAAGLRPLETRLPRRAQELKAVAESAISEVTPAIRLQQLDELRAAGLVSDAEYAAKRTQIIESI